ncbi:phage terminase small subunit [Salibacterium aidingense]|uniref:phage terminase small subunit n=1 Tax=Salibacterium aidingense TaxID=384933 RepID=UPI00040B0A0F|nr:phage terminase small subunit [Salibacterium aidingense]
MAADHKKAEQDYLKGMKYKDIADKYGVSVNTVKSWKRRHGWNREKGAPKEEGVHTKKAGAPQGNKNAIGNRGGAPVGNDNATSHGFFRTIFPDDEETLGIVDAISSKGPVDMLWENIVIKYTAIARAQKLMYVEDQDDMTKEVKKTESVSGEEMDISKEEYEIQFAWDKHATLMTAQSRAMSELRSLIKDFLQLSGQDDQRRLQLEKMQHEMQLSQDKLDLDKAKANVDEGEYEDDGFIDALGNAVEEVWDDDDNTE